MTGTLFEQRIVFSCFSRVCQFLVFARAAGVAIFWSLGAEIRPGFVVSFFRYFFRFESTTLLATLAAANVVSLGALQTATCLVGGCKSVRAKCYSQERYSSATCLVGGCKSLRDQMLFEVRYLPCWRLHIFA